MTLGLNLGIGILCLCIVKGSTDFLFPLTLSHISMRTGPAFLLRKPALFARSDIVLVWIT